MTWPIEAYYGDYAGPPPGGGFLVLNKAQLGSLDLLCAIRTRFPETKIIAQQPLPYIERPDIWLRSGTKPVDRER